MSLIELKLLILALIGIDVIIIIVFVFLIIKFINLNNNKSLKVAVKMLESLLNDADKITGEFKEQLIGKHDFIKQFNEQVDKKIMNLNRLLDRADSYHYSYGIGTSGNDNGTYFGADKQKEILEMAEKGRKVEEIANSLSLPIEEVKLVLDLSKKYPKPGNKEGMS
ncbi:MAG: hypothetical protein U9R17_00590 [Thermodesulfobacteriota bacterium]|nr:hypothetical protein [Thermodesulfobacteriota bacterium]